MFSEVIFVAGGQYIEQLSSSELIDLSGVGNGCIRPDDLPAPATGMSSLKTPAGNPLACGGSYHDDSCLEYVPSETRWIPGPNLLFERRNSPTVQLANGSYWMLCSALGTGIATSEIYEDGVFRQVPGPPCDPSRVYPSLNLRRLIQCPPPAMKQ